MEVFLVSPMKMRLLSIILITLTLSACGLVAGTPEEPGTPMDLPSEVETRVKEALSARTGVAVEEIEVVKAEHREWSNACLGLAEEGEACAEVITPGWEITLRAAGEEYVFRTDEAGDVIRMEE
jgi:hypothetical protein